MIARTVLLGAVALVYAMQHVEGFAQFMFADFAAINVQLGEDGPVEDAAHRLVARAVHNLKVAQ